MKIMDHPYLIKFANFIAPFLGAVMGMWIIYNVETRFFPVVVDFKMDKIEKVGLDWVASGTLMKARPCELLTISVLAAPKTPMVPNVLVTQVRTETVLGGNMPTGLNTWGPWSMTIPAALASNIAEIAHVEVRASHKCHALWAQETHYINIPIDQLPF